MAVFTKHPASAPPGAPVREKTGHLLLRGWCIFVLVTALAGVALVLAVGPLGAGAVIAGSGILSVGLFLVVRPPVQWRRLPWFAVGYIVWATASLAWSAWFETSVATWLLLAITTWQGFFVATVLTWRELVRAVASACKWVLALSVVFELAVSVLVRGPILPGFVMPDATEDTVAFWSQGSLFDGGRIQGIWGDANLLAVVCVVAIIVFGIRFAAGAPRRGLLVAWMALAAYLMYRAESATAYLSAAAVVVVLATVLLMRTAVKPRARTKYYIAYLLVGFGAAAALWIWRDPIFTAVGRSADLAGREQIWALVLDRARDRPVIGGGLATPWLPWDPRFTGWIVENGRTVTQAHSVWVDVVFQLGIVGVILLALTYLAFVWRSWFFAIDRPRWDLVADRPYSPLTLLPTLIGAVLLVQGLAESDPLLGWGWMFLVMLGSKIKQAPLVGVGPAEHTLAIERGELMTRS